MLSVVFVRVCVCTSGEPLVQLLLFEAVAMERNNSSVLCSLFPPLCDGFLTTHVHSFQLLRHYWSMLDPTGA